MQTFYIISEPFNGRIVNTMHGELVDYTGTEKHRNYIDENGSNVFECYYENRLNFEQYQKEKNEPLKVVNEQELEQLFKEHEEKNVLQKFTEITETRYFDLLECLPPKRWHNFKGLEIFFMGECYTSNIYTCCIHDPSIKKYFSALRRITETSEEIETIYKESLKRAK